MTNHLHRPLPTLLTLFFGVLLSHAAPTCAVADEATVKSPNGNIVVVIRDGEHLNYTVSFNDKNVVDNSALGVIVDGADIGRNTTISREPKVVEINEQYPVIGVHRTATNHCNSTAIPIVSDDLHLAWSLEVRVFDDGVAYRYDVPGAGNRHVNGESTEWNVPVGSRLWYIGANNTSYENRFVCGVVGQLTNELQLMAPAALEFPNHAGYGIMTEADLINYSDLSLQLESSNTFKAFFHNNQQGWDVSGEIKSPWRVTILAADLNTLVNSDIIKNLCPPPSPELANAKWIRPGRAAWGWLSCYCAPKLEQQKEWVDNTRKLGFEYYLIDDGWRDWNGGGTNAWNALAQVVQYAKSQNVKVWAWVNAKYVFTSADRHAYFQKAKDIGLVGLKIDFPHPADVEWVNWYEDCLRDAAAMQLMVDFHGAVKPTGRERTWPNEMSREAIAGREQGKNPSLHDTTLPFVRYVQGHADYTPTLFIPERLKGSTYAHELAMAVVYTSPFLCMGDNPEHYLNSAARDVLQALPATWDETIVLPPSEIGQLAAFARRKGNQWFIGVINNTTPRRLEIPLKFLGEGNFKIVELADQPEQDAAFNRTVRKVTSKDNLSLSLRPDGGYVAWLKPE